MLPDESTTMDFTLQVAAAAPSFLISVFDLDRCGRGRGNRRAYERSVPGHVERIGNDQVNVAVDAADKNMFAAAGRYRIAPASIHAYRDYVVPE